MSFQRAYAVFLFLKYTCHTWSFQIEFQEWAGRGNLPLGALPSSRCTPFISFFFSAFPCPEQQLLQTCDSITFFSLLLARKLRLSFNTPPTSLFQSPSLMQVQLSFPLSSCHHVKVAHLASSSPRPTPPAFSGTTLYNILLF